MKVCHYPEKQTENRGKGFKSNGYKKSLAQEQCSARWEVTTGGWGGRPDGEAIVEVALKQFPESNKSRNDSREISI